MSIQESFEDFMEESFETACDSSTIAGWDNSGYCVELFHSGKYRILWEETIGNKYTSEGVIIDVPKLNEEEWDDDKSLRYYENARECMEDKFNEIMEEYQ